MTAPVYTPASAGRMTMEEYGPGAYVTGEAVLEARRALHLNPPGQLWQREAERDVTWHGEPVRGEGYRPFPIVNIPTASRAAWADSIAVGIERRRPLMRANRASRR